MAIQLNEIEVGYTEHQGESGVDYTCNLCADKVYMNWRRAGLTPEPHRLDECLNKLFTELREAILLHVSPDYRSRL